MTKRQLRSRWGARQMGPLLARGRWTGPYTLTRPRNPEVRPVPGKGTEIKR